MPNQEEAVELRWTISHRLRRTAFIDVMPVFDHLAALHAERDRRERAEAERDEWKAACEKATDLAERAANLGIERTAQRDEAWAAQREQLRTEVEGAIGDASCECDPGYSTHKCLVCRVRGALTAATEGVTTDA